MHQELAKGDRLDLWVPVCSRSCRHGSGTCWWHCLAPAQCAQRDCADPSTLRRWKRIFVCNNGNKGGFSENKSLTKELADEWDCYFLKWSYIWKYPNAEEQKDVQLHVASRMLLLLFFYNISAQMLKYNPSPEAYDFRLDRYVWFLCCVCCKALTTRDRTLLLRDKPTERILLMELFRNSFFTNKQ